MIRYFHSFYLPNFLQNVDYYIVMRQIPVTNMKFWVFKGKNSQPWAYLATVGDTKLTDVREAHLAWSIREGDLPTQVNLEDLQ